jgi:hypothetical protein
MPFLKIWAETLGLTLLIFATGLLAGSQILILYRRWVRAGRIRRSNPVYGAPPLTGRAIPPRGRTLSDLFR